ncbi:MAG: hypothetical protein AAF127_14735 [Pseudomonadota bacterium]
MERQDTTDLRTLSELQAFDAMIRFLEVCWQMRGAASDDLSILLSDLSRSVWSNGMSGDPATWSDWREAVSNVLQYDGS